ncbi:MAG: hypothetical protein ACREPL_10300 [Rhodanobacteraceae bacterium]
MGFALALLVPACAFAQNAVNGTWETQLSSVRGMGKPLVIHLKDGMYECNCVPPVKIKADGEQHAVTGHAGFDSVAVQALNDRAIRVTYEKGGKVVTDETITAAPDGKTATYEFTDSSGTAPVTGKGVADRVAKGASGSNAVAGSWKFGHWESMSANGRTFTYKIDGKQVSFSDPTGDSYTADLGGKAVPFTGGGMSGMTVSVNEHGKDGLRETVMHDGKVTRTSTMTVSADGKTMKTVEHDVQAGRTMTMTADKQ